MNGSQHLLSSPARRGAIVFAAAGLAALVAGLGTTPDRAFAALLTAAFFFLTISLGAVVFLALAYVSYAGWHVVLKRVTEAVAGWLPVGALTMLAILPGVRWLYPWAGRPDAEHELVHLRHAFSNFPMFALRMVLLLAVWVLFGFLLRRNSVKQDVFGGLKSTRANVALSAAFLFIVGITFSLASFDWLMTLESVWTSTIFGFYNIGGLLVGSTAGIAVFAILARRRGLLPELNDSHLHDLGRLLFGFSTLWAYLWFSQYLLIWYANLPEETGFYLRREHGGWGMLFWLVPILGWAVPFFTLLPRPAKRDEGTVLRVSLMLLAAHWLDLYMQVGPAQNAEHHGINWVDIAALVGLGAAFLLVVDHVLARAPILAKRDPFLVESLHHHT